MQTPHRKKAKRSRRLASQNVTRTTTHIGFTCIFENKKMYMRSNAEKVAKIMRRTLDTSHHVYYCPRCSHHHIGSNSKRSK